MKVVYYEGGFNYSAINNFGEQYAAGDYILLLNNDTEVIVPIRDKEIKDQDEIDYENHIMEYDDQYLDNSNAQE